MLITLIYCNRAIHLVYYLLTCWIHQPTLFQSAVLNCYHMHPHHSHMLHLPQSMMKVFLAICLTLVQRSWAWQVHPARIMNVPPIQIMNVPHEHLSNHSHTPPTGKFMFVLKYSYLWRHPQTYHLAQMSLVHTARILSLDLILWMNIFLIQ